MTVWRRNISTEYSKCKGSEVGACLVCLQTIMAEAERQRGRKLGWRRVQEPITWDLRGRGIILRFHSQQRETSGGFWARSDVTWFTVFRNAVAAIWRLGCWEARVEVPRPLRKPQQSSWREMLVSWPNIAAESKWLRITGLRIRFKSTADRIWWLYWSGSSRKWEPF